MTEPSIQEHIQYDFLADGHFAELKEAELLNDRINTLNNIEHMLGHSLVNNGFKRMYYV